MERLLPSCRNLHLPLGVGGVRDNRREGDYDEWKILPSLLVVIGAFLFYISDVILAMNKFVAPIKNGRLMNMIAYHLGQIALIAGVVIQYVK